MPFRAVSVGAWKASVSNLPSKLKHFDWNFLFLSDFGCCGHHSDALASNGHWFANQNRSNDFGERRRSPPLPKRSSSLQIIFFQFWFFLIYKWTFERSFYQPAPAIKIAVKVELFFCNLKDCRVPLSHLAENGSLLASFRRQSWLFRNGLTAANRSRPRIEMPYLLRSTFFFNLNLAYWLATNPPDYEMTFSCLFEYHAVCGLWLLYNGVASSELQSDDILKRPGRRMQV